MFARNSSQRRSRRIWRLAPRGSGSTAICFAVDWIFGERADVVVVEGVGGLMSPLTDDDYVADLAVEFKYPLVIVARNALGVISQTLQTLIVATTFRRGLPIAGIVLNHTNSAVAAEPTAAGDPSIHSNRDELARRAVPPVLAEVEWNAREIDPAIDWLRLAKGEGRDTAD